VWFATRNGLNRLQNGQFRTFTTADGLSKNLLMRVFEDRAGVIWVGSGGGIDRLVGDRFENVPSVPKQVAFPYGEDRDGGFFVSLSDASVTLRIYKARVEKLTELVALNDMVETDGGELWFRGNAMYRLPPGSFARSRQHDEPLDYETFSMGDGLTTAETPSPAQSMTFSRDGKVWAAT